MADCFKNAKLSEASKKKYNSFIDKWLSFGIGSMNEVIASPGKAMKALEDSGVSQSHASKHNYISAVVAYILHCTPPDQQALHKPKWIEIQTSNQKPIQERYENQVMTERQTTTAITWNQLLAARKANPDNLLLAIYTYIPPVRADYNELMIFRPSDTIPEKGNYNYIVLGTEYTLVLQEFKTATTYKKIQQVIPEPLKKIIDKSLLEKPRDYLFALESGSPMSPAYFSAWAGGQLTKMLGQKTNLTAIRHAYVENIDYNMPYRELKTITNLMGHSVERSMLYKLKKA